MDVIIEGHGLAFQQHFNDKVEEIKALLDQDGDTRTTDWLIHLTEGLLVYSHSQSLLDLPAQELLALLRRFLEILELRETNLQVESVSLEQRDKNFILINLPDAPFLVDSLTMLLDELNERATIISHPILAMERNSGRLTGLRRGGGSGQHESVMVIDVDRPLTENDPLLEQLHERCALVQAVGQINSELDVQLGTMCEVDDCHEQSVFIEWLRDGNFHCFGYTALDIQKQTRGQALVTYATEPCGLPCRALEKKEYRSGKPHKLTQNARLRLNRPGAILYEPLDYKSPILRHEPLVYLGFRETLGKNHWREHAFIGLFSKKSINAQITHTPPLCEKIIHALQRQHIMANSYDYRKSIEIFDMFPKVELFFLEEKDLDQLVRSFVSLQRRQAVKVVITRWLSLRDVTLLVILPRSYYTQDSARRLDNYLRRYLKADDVDTRVIHFYSDYLSMQVRVVPQSDKLKIDIDAMERIMTELARPWEDRLLRQMIRKFGSDRACQLWPVYAGGFASEYKAMNHPRFAVRDVATIEALLEDGNERFDFWGPFQEKEEYFRLQFYSLRESYLNELMPYLENLGLIVVGEFDANISVDGRMAFIKSFNVRSGPDALPLSELRERLLDLLHALRSGAAENDYLNRLLILTGLTWKQIDIFRAYRNYYFQIGNPFTKSRVAYALINSPRIAILLYRYFEARFKPLEAWADSLQREEEALMPVRMELAEALNLVEDINEDRILRSLFNLIDSTIRSNFFKRCEDDDYFLSFKISAIGIMEMPFPRPLYETYVHSATMEGIHLRGGLVARGGIRWSDRPDDFRTEILGLMKTQMTKNSLIVPVGSKGGFVVKTPYETREEGGRLSREAYITLMRGLLDLVDNRLEGEVVHPDGIVVYDEPDPYLVVAADKGTAHLPDTANSVSIDYGFWLNDAFASGGSQGYDHKKLGITARGAWECVKRHFREMGKDIQSEDFTAVGIGDMSGDVFGNGMLLSKHTRLVAAFDHRHVFLDPSPDAAASWKERMRLFGLARSSWDDYNRELISAGGGIWPRTEKDIPLSAEVRKLLGVRHASTDGDSLIQTILQADVELLWNGGIGTYVRATSESNEDAGDKANDAVRVTAPQIRAKVVGEGGNLGFTQRARIEYALKGGRINTDAVDNSAGVDVSDHEVNLKIFMQTLHDLGVVKTDRTRNKVLKEIQDDVCKMVLANNYSQSLCLSLDLLRCRKDIEPFIDASDRLVNAGLLDLNGEFLPNRKDVVARDQAYARPELSILMSYTKMHLFEALLKSDLPDQEAAHSLLRGYFPELIGKRYGRYIDQHPLRREIIATMLTNYVVDHAGCAFLNRLTRQTGATLVQGVEVYLLFDQVLGVRELRSKVFAADNKLPSERQYEILLILETALDGLCVQAVDLDLPVGLDATCIKGYQEKLEQHSDHLKTLLSHDEWQFCEEQTARLCKEGFDKRQAGQIARFHHLDSFLPAVQIAASTDCSLLDVVDILRRLQVKLDFPYLLETLCEVSVRNRWERMAQTSLYGAFQQQIVSLARAVVEEGQTPDAYLAQRRRRFNYYLELLGGVRSAASPGISAFTVLQQALENID